MQEGKVCKKTMKTIFETSEQRMGETIETRAYEVKFLRCFFYADCTEPIKEEYLTLEDALLVMIISFSYNGYEIGDKRNLTKYNKIEVYKDDEYVDSFKFRISDHSYNPGNNTDEERSGKFCSLVVTNDDPTATVYGCRYNLSFDLNAEIDEIVESVQERFEEIINNYIK